MANTYLYKNQGTATNAKKFTYSVWIKRSKTASGTNQRFYQGWESGNNRFYAFFVDTTGSDADKLWIYAVTGGTIEVYWVSNRRFRDTNAWYHIVFSADSTQASQGDRFKVYVNGVEETSWTKTNNPSQNIDWGNQIAQSTGDLTISGTEGQGQMFDGLMSHIHFIDGTAYDASAFGSTDSVTGEWSINTAPSVTYGSQGYFILKDDNSNLDRSGNNNHFTIGGTLTKTEDNPSNVFATLNPLLYESRDNTFSNGNNTVTNAGSNDWSNHYGSSTLAMSSGKWYVEAKVVTRVGSQAPLGIVSTTQVINSSLQDVGRGAVISSGEIAVFGSVVQSGLTAIASGDIIGAAFDATNGTLQFYRNGSTYGNQLTSIPSDEYYFTCNSYDGGQIAFNFGNGYFSTTAVATNSGNGYQDADGNGIFNYTVPTNYRALCTKGLNQ